MDYFEKLANYLNKANLYTEKMGIKIEELRPGYSRVTNTVEPDETNSINVPHGSVYLSLADHAAGAAYASYGYMAVTTSLSFNYLRSANVGDFLTAEATEVKYGKTLGVYEVEVKNQDGVLIGKGTFTQFRTNTPYPVE